MAGIRQIKQRHRAISNIRKVTRTMEMISSARYRRYYNSWKNSQPFFDGLAQLAYLMVTAEEKIDAPLLLDHSEGDLAVLVLGTDRGLCGAYNSNLMQMLEVHVKRAKRLRKRLRVYVSGRKTATQLRARHIPIEEELTGFDGIPTNEQSDKLSDELIAAFCDKKISYAGVVYTRFYSNASQRPQTLTLMPLYELIDDICTRTNVIWPWEATFEDFEVSPPPKELFPEIAKMMVRSALAECFIDAAASENLTRVNAMRNASVNADEMLTSLSSEYNKARQGQITNELMDIVGGVEALS
jgi:F-type H+-transporting ATPase subunit gamma